MSDNYTVDIVNGHHVVNMQPEKEEHTLTVALNGLAEDISKFGYALGKYIERLSDARGVD